MTIVKEFHLAFGHPVEGRPTMPNIKQRALRVRMLAEELTELADAFGVEVCVVRRENGGLDNYEVVVEQAEDLTPNIVEAADALGDIRYLVDGGNLICGIDGEAVLAEIHRSNMSKLGADGQPVRRADGKTLKGPNYFKPDIAKVLGL